jgi:glutamyl-tRNA synthetase
LVKGPISFDNSELDDLVILKSDGAPTYHLAVVVDDVDMGMTHVIRGDDHVNNTPRQILLYKAMDAALPHFAHVPMILGPDKKKLSKRHGATNVVQYREMGYLPEAMLNALARLGWSHGDQEIFSRDELIKYFDLDACGKSAAVFDMDKLTRLNQRYIQEADAKKLAELTTPFIHERGVKSVDNAVLISALPHLTPRAKDLTELADWAEPYLVDEPVMDPKAVKKFLKPQNVKVLEEVKALAVELGVDDTEPLEAGLKALAEKLEIKLGGLAQPTRVAMTGRTFSPGIFEVMGILGLEKVKVRFDRAIAMAKNAGL